MNTVRPRLSMAMLGMAASVIPHTPIAASSGHVSIDCRCDRCVERANALSELDPKDIFVDRYTPPPWEVEAMAKARMKRIRKQAQKNRTRTIQRENGTLVPSTRWTPYPL